MKNEWNSIQSLCEDRKTVCVVVCVCVSSCIWEYFIYLSRCSSVLICEKMSIKNKRTHTPTSLYIWGGCWWLQGHAVTQQGDCLINMCTHVPLTTFRLSCLVVWRGSHKTHQLSVLTFIAFHLALTHTSCPNFLQDLVLSVFSYLVN